MKKAKSLDRKLETSAWGLLLIWWGLRWWPLAFLPNGTGLVGTGLILLGLNMIRSLNNIPVRSSTNTIGILALVFGGLLMISDILGLSVRVPLFEIVLIGGGVFILARELLRIRKTSIKGAR
jgi:hypothetical protein